MHQWDLLTLKGKAGKKTIVLQPAAELLGAPAGATRGQAHTPLSAASPSRLSPTALSSGASRPGRLLQRTFLCGE